jgi:hypothetical protein
MPRRVVDRFWARKIAGPEVGFRAWRRRYMRTVSGHLKVSEFDLQTNPHVLFGPADHALDFREMFVVLMM